MDAKPTLIHIDHPAAFPLGKVFLVQGWVVADHPVISVHVGFPGPQPLAMVARPDVVAAHPGYRHAIGFAGQVATRELKDGCLRIHCQLENADPALLEKGLNPQEVPPDKPQRLERIRHHLRTDLPFEETPFHFDFLTGPLRDKYGVIETENVSGFPYAPRIREIIDRFESGLVLDCGAGSKKHSPANVVNLEIAPYVSTDVLAVAEELPFRDDTFDAIISCAVLEHLRNPFTAAREMIRVTKPGGIIRADVPFLQPYHGYPSHYYNMTSQGLANLFADGCEIQETSVPDYGTPIWTLTWFLNSYLAGLPAGSRDKLKNLRVRDLLDHPETYRDLPFVRELSTDKRFELACTTSVTAVVRK